MKITIKEDEFNQLGYSSTAWNFGNRSGDIGYVGTVACKNILLAAVLEPSRLGALNVACEFAVQILKENPSIISQLQEVRSKVAE